MAQLIERAKVTSRQVLASLTRLSIEQRETEVHCHLTHDGELTLDRPVPWEAVAVSTQAEMHLPAHIEQLRNLRVS